MSNLPHLLLAAGTSRRMGTPKQLLSWGSKKLIEFQIETILPTTDTLLIILGAYADQIKPHLTPYPVHYKIFDQWEKGMGASLAYGIQELQKKIPSAEGVLISLIDQPLVKDLHYLKMRSAFIPNKKQIITSESEQGWLGVPVLFDAHYFDQLIKLQGKQGAKALLKKHPNQLISIGGGKTLIDMDTPEIYQRLVKQINPQ